ncbi:MAG: hypothetical protein VXV86_05925, partial [Verrucomicrobiota bacterium]|nr:hypothetical protein [Verrucomicrobiota bacterium]
MASMSLPFSTRVLAWPWSAVKPSCPASFCALETCNEQMIKEVDNKLITIESHFYFVGEKNNR